jgi:hypothetical protein
MTFGYRKMADFIHLAISYTVEDTCGEDADHQLKRMS